MTHIFIAEHYVTLIEQAYKLDKIDAEAYERLRRVPISTLDDADRAYAGLSECMRTRLLDRIKIGAEYIEQHGPMPTAVKRYDALCDELQRLEGRVYDGTIAGKSE